MPCNVYVIHIHYGGICIMVAYVLWWHMYYIYITVFVLHIHYIIHICYATIVCITHIMIVCRLYVCDTIYVIDICDLYVKHLCNTYL